MIQMLPKNTVNSRFLLIVGYTTAKLITSEPISEVVSTAIVSTM
jgi:hypothetical protein